MEQVNISANFKTHKILRNMTRYLDKMFIYLTNKQTIIFLIFTISCILSSATGASATQTPKQHSEPTQRNAVSQEQAIQEQESQAQETQSQADVTPPPLVDKYTWLNHLKREMPKFNCQPDQLYRTCFDVSEETCLKFTDIYLTACIDNAAMQLPSKLSEEDSQYWGNKLIYCSQTLYAKFMNDKKKPLAQCEFDRTITQSEPKASD